ncbi:MAG: STAS domain-containing protein [Oscillospiraceae bacterium]|nr:STAS domain-containing protein [Oscillospiraceae bacterium]
MKVFSTYDNGRLTVQLHGELDHHAVRDAAELIERLLAEYLPRSCVLDLGGLSFMDSSGIALILRVHRRMVGSGGRVWVEQAKGQPLRVLDAGGVERLVRIVAQKEAKRA